MGRKRDAEGIDAEGRGAEFPLRLAKPEFRPSGSPITGVEDVTSSPIPMLLPN